MSWLSVLGFPSLCLTVCIRVSNSFSFLGSGLMSSMYIRWLVLCDLLSFYPSVHFLGMWLNGIIAITNSNGFSASPWNIPLWIFTSAKLFPPAVNSTLQVSTVFSIKFMTLSGILYILRQGDIIFMFTFESFSHQRERWFLNGVLVTTRLLKSPGPFLVFWPITIMQ